MEEKKEKYYKKGNSCNQCNLSKEIPGNNFFFF